MLRHRHQGIDGRADALIDLLVPVCRLGAYEAGNSSRPVDFVRKDEAVILSTPLEEVHRVLQVMTLLSELHLLKLLVVVTDPLVGKVGTAQIIQ
jgi:hypothetical protein